MSIYPDRKNGKLTGRFRVEVQRGTTRLKGRVDSMREAQDLETELIRRLDSGEVAIISKKVANAPRLLTVGEASVKAERLLWIGQSTEANSLRKLARVVKIIGPDVLVDDVDLNTIDTVLEEIKPGTPATANRYLSCLSAFLNFCIDREFRSKPLPKLKWREEDETRIRWITLDEEAELLRLLPEPYSTVAYIAIRTGLRAAELLDLTPSQVDLSWIKLDKTKNKSWRDVPITRDLFARLSPLVTSGSLPTYPQMRHQWDMARIAMGLMDDPTFVFHACRHTYATRAIQAGVNIRVLQKLMGHKTIQTTLRYAHVEDSTLTDAAAAMATLDGMAPARRGNKGGGKAMLSAPRGATRTAEIPRSEMSSGSTRGLQILARRFDSGSGLQGNQQFNDND